MKSTSEGWQGNEEGAAYRLIDITGEFWFGLGTWVLSFSVNKQIYQ